MKTIGLLGGMSWESTVGYYQAINTGINRALGGLHSAKICLYSVDFNEIEKLQHADKWDETATILARGAQAIEAGGADFLIICTNTMHKVAASVASSISIPLVHIADATAQRLVADGVKRVGLLGTRFTMEQGFYKDRITETFGIDVLVPQPHERDLIHQVIYSELCHGKINSSSRKKYIETIDNLHSQGAEAIILGCTEIGLLVQQEHTHVPLYDTTGIHAAKAVELALDESLSRGK